ncbi:MAG: hypothetical protein KGY56_08540 [Desulfobacterales bacterium]|nr:hypothetical protein [Desulfobacterales bacterium]
MKLMPRQESVYRVIRKYHREYGYSPSVREICGKLGFVGPAGVHWILGVLEEKGGNAVCGGQEALMGAGGIGGRAGHAGCRNHCRGRAAGCMGSSG